MEVGLGVLAVIALFVLIVLFAAMEKLNALQRRVLYYLFFTDLTQMEAARRIGISQKHVSRVLASSLTKLRALISPAM